MTGKSRVAVLYTQPETVLQDYQRLFELASGTRALHPDVPTILKDNITWHFPMPGANTTPWQLEGTIRALCQAGLTQLVCVQNQTVITNAFKGEDLNGYVPIFRHYNIPVRYNFRKSDMTWIEYRPKAKMLALDQIYPEGIRIPDFFIGKNILHLPTTKTHMYTTITGAMKNAFGGLLSKYRHYTHTWIHETLVDLLAIQKEIHPGIFAMMDGTTAGTGAGPRMLRPMVKNIILASPDQVAIDAVAAKLMGFDPLSIKFIRLAHEQGLGVGDPREIELVGDDVSRENWNFKVGHNSHSFLAWLAWYGPTKVFQKLVLRTPLVVVPTLIGEIEQDYLYWPLKYKKIAARWRDGTCWGQLFQQYQARGFLVNDKIYVARGIMPVHCRSYQKQVDFQLIGDFLTRHFQPGNRDGNWLQPTWEYMHSHPYLDETSLDRIGIWEEAGEIVGVAHYESRLGEVFLEIHPDYARLKREMLDYAEKHLFGITKTGDRFVEVFVNDFDADLGVLVRDRGYQRDPDNDRPMSILEISGQIPDVILPPGFRVQSLQDDNDLHKIDRVLWRGFNHPGEPPEDGIEDRKKMQSTPNFRKDLTIVTVAPDGQFTCFCGLWYDPVNRLAYVEPLATDPDYRRMGLARAAIWEGIRRCEALGAVVAFVGSDQLFYQSVGFQKIYTSQCWTKELSNQE